MLQRFAPRWLSKEYYNRIQDQMLIPDAEDLPTAACAAQDLQPFTYFNRQFDQTFARQITDIYDNPGSILPGMTEPPAAFLFTAKSAIPVADSVRGFYDELGVHRPLMGFVAVNTSLSNLSAENRHEMLASEAARLRPFVEGAAHVCVLDQDIFTGRSLQNAAKILEMAGVDNVSLILGNWYNDAVSADIDYQGVTSVHAPKMHEIGLLACRQSQMATA